MKSNTNVELVKASVSDLSSDFFCEQIKILQAYKDFRNIRHLKHQHESVLAWSIIYDRFQHLGVPFTVQYSGNGKPYIPDSPLKFSISHSHGFVAVGFSEFEIGVDIELIFNKDNSKLYKRVLSENENRLIKQSSDESSLFYRLWTLKESRLKLTGDGLSYDMKNLDFSEYMKSDSFYCGNYYYKTNIINGLSFAICSELPFELKELPYERH